MKKNNQHYKVTCSSELLPFLVDVVLMTKRNAKSLLTHGCIYLDGKVVTKHNTPLMKGQTLERRELQNHKYVLDSRLKIIYEDEHLIAVIKPTKLLTIATSTEKEDTMYRIVSDYVKAKKKQNRIFIVHRLDRDTSAIMIFAKSEKIKRMLQDHWDELVSKREYIAVVEGTVEKEEGTIQSYLYEDGVMVKSSKQKMDGKLAITKYRKMQANGQYTMLSILLKTGRKNQIRVHMRELGTTVIGDKKYGARKDPLRRLGLHASTLILTHPVTHQTLSLNAPTPKSFSDLFLSRNQNSEFHKARYNKGGEEHEKSSYRHERRR